MTAGDQALFAQTWAVLPKSQWTAALGQWIGGTSTSVNGTGVNFTNGIDYGLSYSLPKSRFGQFRFSTQWAQFLKKQTQTSPTAAVNDSIVGLNTAEWKGSATIQWRRKAWSASLSGAYTGATRTGATTTQSVYQALGSPNYIRVVTTNGSTSYVEIGEDQVQLNGSVSYQFSSEALPWFKGATVRLGINNLLDAQPTLSTSSTGYSGSTGESVWIGRAFSAEIRRSF